MTLAEKIIAFRRSNGLTQEVLAEQCGVTLRTIQRIEKGENVPRGHTLRAIAAVLGEPIETLTTAEHQTSSTGQDENDEVSSYLQLMNLSSFAYLMMPFGNIILPLILWKRKKGIAIVNETGRRILKYHVIWTIATHLSLFVMLLVQLAAHYYWRYTPGFLILGTFFALYLVNVPVILNASLQLRKGNRDIYALTHRLF
jgi:transcriptional regulator with XRE-family HTH domain